MHTNQLTTLRRVLLLNATTSGLGGLAALVAGDAVAELLGTEAVGVVRLVGAGLVLFAAAVAMLARADEATLLRFAREVSVGDAAWVVATAVTIGLGWYSTRGVVVMASVAVMVGGYAVAQWRLSATDDRVGAGTTP